ncbi:Wadjet anti-phage system protein JetD domain-containing protein [Massilia niabensis]|uniref:Wadjet anti-phage system protein JetD domain-containing protein n=1 Tax=Massilia niabensis TaxID=544910 RepID=A0ABW0LA28_9BURK
MELAYSLLGQLLTASERAHAGVRTRPAVLTAHDLRAYRETKSLKEKDEFEAVMKACRAQHAVNLFWDHGAGSASDAFIKRVCAIDVQALASFVGRTPHSTLVAAARASLAAHFEAHPVLEQVLAQWDRLKLVRRTGPADMADWVDAVRILELAMDMQAEASIQLPIREASYRIFHDTKRLEKLAGPVDVLLLGDIDTAPRSANDVWQELGLFREEQPFRLSGNVVIQRTRVTATLDAPYAAFSATTVLGLQTPPKYVLSIENLTTFHSEARRLCDEPVLVLYTNGMPSPTWREAYLRLVHSTPLETPIRHWGDVDEGGFRIAALLASDLRNANRMLSPWRMHPDDIAKPLRRPASEALANRMACHARKAGWDDLARQVQLAKITVEQEGL